MNVEKAGHPAEEQLRAFGLGRLDEVEMDQIAEHVASCDLCCRQLGQLSEDSLLARLKNADTDHPHEETLGPVSVRPLTSKRDKDKQSRDLTPSALRDHPRYRVLKFIGHGGMGDVFQAEHRVMGNLVALKVIRSELLGRPKAVQRFQQEVRAAAGLNHRNIVRAFDAELADDLHFLVMEFVEGKSLDQLVAERGPLPIRHACNYARQVAQGLDHAHQHGMVHRDVKPHNLMLTERGEVKILDFGLARIGQLAATSQGDASLTVKGTTLGTPDYVAPEQIRDASQVDHRADLYSLGCTLYFLLTASPPFPADSSVEKLRLQLQGEPRPLEQFREDIPSELADLVRQLMAKQPEQRPTSAREVAELLAPFATKPGQPPTAGTAAPVVASVPAATGMPRKAGSPAVGGAASPAIGGTASPAVGVAPAVGGSPRAVAVGALPAAAALPADPQSEIVSLEAVAPASSNTGAGYDLSTILPESDFASSARSTGLAVSNPAVVGQAATSAVARRSTGLRKTVWRGLSADGKRWSVVAGGSLIGLAILFGVFWFLPPIVSRPNISPLIVSPPVVAPSVAAGQRVLVVIPSREVWINDLRPLQAGLAAAGIAMDVASTTRDPVSSFNGDRSPAVPIRPDLLLDDVQLDRYEAIILIGYQVSEYLPNGGYGPQLRQLLERALERPRMTVASVCAANAVLARQGLLRGRRAASSPWANQLGAQPSDADWTDEAIESDGPFLTARDDQNAGPLVNLVIARLQAGRP